MTHLREQETTTPEKRENDAENKIENAAQGKNNGNEGSL
jgi:hypothetical protein